MTMMKISEAIKLVDKKEVRIFYNRKEVDAIIDRKTMRPVSEEVRYMVCFHYPDSDLDFNTLGDTKVEVFKLVPFEDAEKLSTVKKYLESIDGSLAQVISNGDVAMLQMYLEEIYRLIK